MIPWLRIGAAAVVLVGTFAGGAGVGAKWVRGEWAQAELERQQEAARTALRRQEAAAGAAQTYEEARDAIRRDLLATMPRVAPALASRVPQCPAVEVGAVVLPSGALDRLRAAAGELAAAADPGKPGQAVPPGPGTAGR